MKNRRAFIFFSVLVVILLACSEIFRVDLKVGYPFNKDDQSTYTINVDDAMEQVNETIKETTVAIAEQVLFDSGLIPKELLVDGAEYSVEADLTIDHIILLINGDDVGVDVTLEVTLPPDNKVVSETITVDFSICDFAQDTTFEALGVEMEIRNVAKFCADRKEENKPYVYILHKNDPFEILLSEQEDIAENIEGNKDKIFAATINKLELEIIEAAEGFGDDTTVAIDASMLVGKITEEFDTKEEQMVVYEEENGKLNENFWIGDFLIVDPDGNDAPIAAGNLFKLRYTYKGRAVLQEALKHLDFFIGIRSEYIIRPGSVKPSGQFKLGIKGEFFFTVEPLN